MLELKNISFGLDYNCRPQSFSASVKLVSKKEEFTGSGLGSNSIAAVQSAVLNAFSKKKKLPKKLNIFYLIQQIQGRGGGEGHCAVGLHIETQRRTKAGSKIGEDMIIVFAQVLISVINEIAP